MECDQHFAYSLLEAQVIFNPGETVCHIEVNALFAESNELVVCAAVVARTSRAARGGGGRRSNVVIRALSRFPDVTEADQLHAVDSVGRAGERVVEFESFLSDQVLLARPVEADPPQLLALSN